MVKALAKRAKSRLIKLANVDPDVPNDPMKTHRRRMTKRALQLRNEARIRAGARAQKPPADVVGVRRARAASDRLRKKRAALKPKNRARMAAEEAQARRDHRFDKTPKQWRTKVKKEAYLKRRWGTRERLERYRKVKQDLAKTSAKERQYRYRKGLGVPESYDEVKTRGDRLRRIVKKFDR